MVTVKELKLLAKNSGIKGYSTMTKEQLIRAIEFATPKLKEKSISPKKPTKYIPKRERNKSPQKVFIKSDKEIIPERYQYLNEPEQSYYRSKEIPRKQSPRKQSPRKQSPRNYQREPYDYSFNAPRVYAPSTKQYVTEPIKQKPPSYDDYSDRCLSWIDEDRNNEAKYLNVSLSKSKDQLCSEMKNSSNKNGIGWDDILYFNDAILLVYLYNVLGINFNKQDAIPLVANLIKRDYDLPYLKNYIFKKYGINVQKPNSFFGFNYGAGKEMTLDEIATEIAKRKIKNGIDIISSQDVVVNYDPRYNIYEPRTKRPPGGKITLENIDQVDAQVEKDLDNENKKMTPEYKDWIAKNSKSVYIRDLLP